MKQKIKLIFGRLEIKKIESAPIRLINLWCFAKIDWVLFSSVYQNKSPNFLMKSRHCRALFVISDNRRKRVASQLPAVSNLNLSFGKPGNQRQVIAAHFWRAGIFAETLFWLARGIAANVFDRRIKGWAAKSTRKTQYLVCAFPWNTWAQFKDQRINENISKI